MSTPRFFIKMVDPDDVTKERVVWGSPANDLEPDETTEADERPTWDGLIYKASSDEEWGKCGGEQKIYLGGKSVKLGLDIADVGEEVKTRIAYSSNRGKLLEDQVIALAQIVAGLGCTEGTVTNKNTSGVVAAIRALQ